MKFDELEAKLRIFETAEDFCVLPGIFMVARVDGRSFTRLTREVHKFEAPFDERFRDYMVATTEHLMDCGFRIIYGYTQSDEISLVFHRDDTTFSRKTRKLNSVLAGEASAKFSLLLGDVASFDCRICQLPTKSDLMDYLRWRAEDAHRNALNAHCYWALRKDGAEVGSATDALLGLSTSEKNELLFAKASINFNDLPAWQKRGVGLYREFHEIIGRNPRTGEETKSQRRRIRKEFELPMKEEYRAFVGGIVDREHEGF
jgi:tRNA(His) 5'-end guanylyltransferase